MSAPKGYADKAKTADGHPDYATINPVKYGQFGLDVVAHAFVYLVGTDAVEASSTARVINATAHAALPGDEILMTSGTQSGRSPRVLEITTNTITLAEALAAAPAAADTFSIRRQRQGLVDSTGALSVAVSSGDDHNYGTPGAATLRTAAMLGVGSTAVSSTNPVPTSTAGQAYADSVFYDHVVPVTTGAWTQLIAATAAVINALMLFDSSGETLELGVGAALSEARVLLIPPGGIDGLVPLRIAAGVRLSVRAVSANTAGGNLVLQGLT